MKRGLTAAGLLFTLLAAGMAQNGSPTPPASPFIGKWKINLETSSYSPGPKPGAGYISVYQWVARPDGFIVGTSMTINEQGVPSFNLTVAKHDGKDYAYYGTNTLPELMVNGTKSPQTYAFKPIDACTVELIGKNNGKLVNQKRIRTLSADGKTMTDATKGTNAQGQAFNNVVIYDRVQ